MTQHFKLFTDEELLALIQEGITTHAEQARRLGVNESTIRGRKKKLERKGYPIQTPSGKVNVPDGWKIKGVSAYCDNQGNILRQWIKTDTDKERQVEIIKEMCQAFIDELPKYELVPLDSDKPYDEDLMLVLPIGDLHVGMMSWKDETGNNWSIEHTKMAVFHVFKMLIEQAPNVKKILIINLGDFGHRDGKHAVTPNSGHQLDVDSRYPKMARTCIQLQRYIIELALNKAEEVEMINVSGNHDQCLAIMLSECLANVYENEPRITINTSPAPVKYSEWGKVMVATTHGDTIKMEKLPGVAANDQSEMWGRTKFRYGMTGHIHSSNKIAKEETGMYVESFRTLAPGDSFAAWYGWRSGQDAHGLLFHKEFGSRGRNEIGIIMIKEYLDKL